LKIFVNACFWNFEVGHRKTRKDAENLVGREGKSWAGEKNEPFFITGLTGEALKG